MNKKIFVYTQFQKEGYHCFPEADTDTRYKTDDWLDVSHLGSRHMHYFFFKVWVEVSHTNRDIEFIQLRRWLEALYDNKAIELNNQSCEMMCDGLYKRLKDKYPDSEIRIDVSEDNITGA